MVYDIISKERRLNNRIFSFPCIRRLIQTKYV